MSKRACRYCEGDLVYAGEPCMCVDPSPTPHDPHRWDWRDVPWDLVGWIVGIVVAAGGWLMWRCS
jgi:hypothetical protein